MEVWKRNYLLLYPPQKRSSIVEKDLLHFWAYTHNHLSEIPIDRIIKEIHESFSICSIFQFSGNPFEFQEIGFGDRNASWKGFRQVKVFVKFCRRKMRRNLWRNRKSFLLPNPLEKDFAVFMLSPFRTDYHYRFRCLLQPSTENSSWTMKDRERHFIVLCAKEFVLWKGFYGFNGQ